LNKAAAMEPRAKRCLKGQSAWNDYKPKIAVVLAVVLDQALREPPALQLPTPATLTAADNVLAIPIVVDRER
jgi:hypothetical protein